MATSLISIIVPVYKVEEYLDECVQSLINQTYFNIEIILIDDGSPDRCPQMCDEWARKDSRIRVIHKKNGGLSSARNVGMNVANGEYICFVDSDDELPHNAIELFVSPLKNKSVDLVVGKYKFVGKTRDLPLSLEDGTLLENDQILSSYALGKWDVTACNKMYRLDFLKLNKLIFKEGLIHEDILWSFQVACLAHSLYVVNKETYIYKIRENSIVTSELLEDKISTYRTVLLELYDFAMRLGVLYDSSVHTIIENLRFTIVNIGKESFDLEKDIYIDLRKRIGLSWIRCLMLDKYDFKKQIRDFHLFLPPILGFYYVYMISNIRFKIGCKQ